MKKFAPVVLLFLLAPAIGELLSGSSPPVEFFNPFNLYILAALYGSGAILARELAVRWQKGWSAILILGLAYGILEEGLMVKSWFDPAWVDLGPMATYGRWAGVNWAWAAMLTLYHAVFSISIPILIVHLLYPQRSREAWLGPRGMLAFTILLGVDVVFGYTLMTTYQPPPLATALACLAVVALYFLARRLPAFRPPPGNAHPVKPWLLGVLGFLLTVGLFFLGWVVPNTAVPALVTILLMLGLATAGWRLVYRLSGQGNWRAPHQAALLTGALAFFIILAPLSQLDPNRTDNPSGMAFVALAAAILLFLLNRRAARPTHGTYDAHW